MKPAAIRSLFAVSALAVTSLVASCGGNSTTAPQQTPPPKGTIQVGDNFFNPSSVTIAAGDSITWRWIGSHDHSVTEGTTLGGAHAFDSGVKTSGTFGMRFNNAATVHYFCSVHFSSMKGTITVTP